MPTSDPVEILLQQNRWATRNLLATCAQLPAEQFHQWFEMGRGSLHDNVTHILAAMRGWGDLLAGREQRERLEEGGQRSPEELLTLLEELADDLEASARAHPADEVITGSRGGRSYAFTRGGVLVHVTTHGMHHRAQCLNMLRQLGVDPLPPSAVVEWILMADE
jgi:uncharacterized damage-inducible protein DinB